MSDVLCAVLQAKACSPGVELASSRRGKTPTPVIMLIPKKNRKEVYKYLFKGKGPLPKTCRLHYNATTVCLVPYALGAEAGVCQESLMAARTMTAASHLNVGPKLLCALGVVLNFIARGAREQAIPCPVSIE